MSRPRCLLVQTLKLGNSISLPFPGHASSPLQECGKLSRTNLDDSSYRLSVHTLGVMYISPTLCLRTAAISSENYATGITHEIQKSNETCTYPNEPDPVPGSCILLGSDAEGVCIPDLRQARQACIDHGSSTLQQQQKQHHRMIENSCGWRLRRTVQ